MVFFAISLLLSDQWGHGVLLFVSAARQGLFERLDVAQKERFA